MEVTPLLVVVFVVAGLVVAFLVLALLRGAFGTPGRRTRYELDEMAAGGEVPEGALRHGTAVCLGHDSVGQQLRGVGLLWLTERELGFVLRQPRVRWVVDLEDVHWARPADGFDRPGFSEHDEHQDYLVVEWSDDYGRAVIGWRAAGAAGWAEDVEAARRAR